MSYTTLNLNLAELSTVDMNNKLFCTFTREEDLDFLIKDIVGKYNVLYNKLFVLYIKDQNEYAITYNIDLANVSGFLPGTILVHRKKETKTLYTINALNMLVREANNGILDPSYKVNWNEHRNSILLTKGPEFKRLSTQLFKVVEI